MPVVENIVFFKYARSPIALYQMNGRAAHLHPPSGKLVFCLYDSTNAILLFGLELKSRWQPRARPDGASEPASTIHVEGFDGRVTDAGRSSI